jgi:hypothetical protein
MQLKSFHFLKLVVWCHRWLGVGCCLLFLLWFVSGMVMMYWGFPEVGSEEQLAKAELLTPEAIRVSAAAAYDRAQRMDSPAEARLTMLDGRPVYRFLLERSQAVVYADSGEPLPSVPPDMALRIAAAWTGRPAAKANFEGSLNEADQWTVSGEYRSLRPLLKYAWPDGDQVYVSAVTGEVVQHTTRESRLAAYFGAIPHWFYWTPLRKNGRAWSKVVEWSAGIGTAVSLLGLLAGAWKYSPAKRYRYRSKPSGIPYHGQKRWHMILGLSFGALACAWVFSGLLSMEPFEWLLRSDESASRVENVLRGGSLNLKAFAPISPAEAMRQTGLKVKQLEFVIFGGEPYYLARESTRISRVVSILGNSSEQFERAAILRLVAQTSWPAAVAEARVLNEHEAYYLDRHQKHPLPALFVRLNDAHGSTFYIDLKTARIVEAYDDRSRWNRWLYHGLHSWNFPWLYRNRPAWDILVLSFLLGGTSLSITAVILGFQLLRARLHTRVTTP